MIELAATCNSTLKKRAQKNRFVWHGYGQSLDQNR